jgi:3-hydroxyisobutyrate dehydrogenase
MEKGKIGFIGTGIIGSSMVRNLCRAGYSVYVYNRTKEKAQALSSEGAFICDTLAELASQVSTVQICVTNGEALKDILFDEGGLITETSTIRLIIDHSTIAPRDALSVGHRLNERGVQFIDAPVSGGDTGARNGTLSVMVGGEAADVAEAMPLLEVVGERITHIGPTPSGQLMKCANQFAVAVSVAAMTEALAFAEHSGLNLQTTIDVLGSGAAGSWSFANYGPRIVAGDFAPGFMARDMLKDLEYARQEAVRLGLDVPVVSAVLEQFADMVSEGNGENGVQALITQYRAN